MCEMRYDINGERMPIWSCQEVGQTFIIRNLQEAHINMLNDCTSLIQTWIKTMGNYISDNGIKIAIKYLKENELTWNIKSKALHSDDNIESFTKLNSMKTDNMDKVLGSIVKVVHTTVGTTQWHSLKIVFKT